MTMMMRSVFSSSAIGTRGAGSTSSTAAIRRLFSQQQQRTRGGGGASSAAVATAASRRRRAVTGAGRQRSLYVFSTSSHGGVNLRLDRQFSGLRQLVVQQPYSWKNSICVSFRQGQQSRCSSSGGGSSNSSGPSSSDDKSPPVGGLDSELDLGDNGVSSGVSAGGRDKQQQQQQQQQARGVGITTAGEHHSADVSASNDADRRHQPQQQQRRHEPNMVLLLSDDVRRNRGDSIVGQTSYFHLNSMASHNLELFADIFSSSSPGVPSAFASHSFSSPLSRLVKSVVHPDHPATPSAVGWVWEDDDDDEEEEEDDQDESYYYGGFDYTTTVAATTTSSYDDDVANRAGHRQVRNMKESRVNKKKQELGAVARASLQRRKRMLRTYEKRKFGGRAAAAAARSSPDGSESRSTNTTTLELMNRNARRAKRANKGKRPCSRIRRRMKRDSIGNHRR